MSKLKVRDLMTTQVVTLKPDDTVKKAVIKFALDNISGAPVVDNRNHSWESSARTTFSVCFSSTRRHWMTTVPDP